MFFLTTFTTKEGISRTISPQPGEKGKTGGGVLNGRRVYHSRLRRYVMKRR